MGVLDVRTQANPGEHSRQPGASDLILEEPFVAAPGVEIAPDLVKIDL